jgi:site-specific DNA-methyltransferase (adenine-specific)
MIDMYCDRAEVIQPKLACQSVDMVLTDACYGIGKVYSWGKEPSDPWKHWATIRPLYEDWFRLLKRGGAVALFQARKYQERFLDWVGPHGIVVLAHRKTNGINARADWDADLCILQDWQRRPVPVPYAYRQVKPIKGVDNVFPDHPCPKCVAGVEFLLNWLCPPGGTVYDPFMGSGTTCLAALRTGRSAIGVDRSYKYYRLAVARIKKENEAGKHVR